MYFFKSISNIFNFIISDSLMRSQPPTGVETQVNSWGSKVLVAGREEGKEGCWYEG